MVTAFISPYINGTSSLYVSASVWSLVIQQTYVSVCCLGLWKRHLHFSAMSVTHLENCVPADAPSQNSVEMTRTGRSSPTSFCFLAFTHSNLISRVWVYSILLVSTVKFHQNVCGAGKYTERMTMHTIVHMRKRSIRAHKLTNTLMPTS